MSEPLSRDISLSDRFVDAAARTNNRALRFGLALVACGLLLLFAGSVATGILLYKGTALIDEGRPDEAVAPLETALSINPRSRRAWRVFFKACARAGLTEKAERLATRALEILRDAPFVFVSLGESYLESRSLDEAVEAFKKALLEDAGALEAWYLLAKTYRESGNRYAENEALRSLVTATESSDLNRLVTIAIEAQDEDYYAAAEMLLRFLVRTGSANVNLLNNLAWLYATAEDPRFRRPRAALDYALRAVEAGGLNSSIVLDTLAEAYYVNGLVEQALRVNKAAIGLAEKRPAERKHLQEYRERRRKYKKAQRRKEEPPKRLPPSSGDSNVARLWQDDRGAAAA